MNKAIISAIYSSGEEVFLFDINDVLFSKDKQKSLQFDDIESARSKVSSRFILLSYWISQQENLQSIMINEIDNNCKIIKRERYL